MNWHGPPSSPWTWCAVIGGTAQRSRRYGSKLWTYLTGNVVNCAPAVAKGVVYVGSTDDNVYALNAAIDGKKGAGEDF